MVKIKLGGERERCKESRFQKVSVRSFCLFSFLFEAKIYQSKKKKLKLLLKAFVPLGDNNAFRVAFSDERFKILN